MRRSIAKVGYWSGLAEFTSAVAYDLVQISQVTGALRFPFDEILIFVQLATVIPAKLGGTSEAIRILEQTPHSLFWNFDALGYISMGWRP